LRQHNPVAVQQLFQSSVLLLCLPCACWLQGHSSFCSRNQALLLQLCELCPLDQVSIAVSYMVQRTEASSLLGWRWLCRTLLVMGQVRAAALQ
jgi:hypothetical protein